MKHPFLRKAVIVLCVLFLFVELMVSFHSLLMWVVDTIDYNTFSGQFVRRYLFETGFGLSFLSITAFVIIYRKRSDFLKFIVTCMAVLFLSFTAAYVLAMLFGMGQWWFMKYTIGVIVGVVTYLITGNKTDTHAVFLAGFAAFFGLLFCEQVEYLRGMDPSPFPSILYSNSFPNTLVWFLFLLLAVAPAPMLASGFPFCGEGQP